MKFAGIGMLMVHLWYLFPVGIWTFLSFSHICELENTLSAHFEKDES